MAQAKFLEEADGTKSSTRLYVLMIVIYAIASGGVTLGVGLHMYTQGHETLAGVVTASVGGISSLLAIAAAWKQMAKNAENKSATADSK